MMDATTMTESTLQPFPRLLDLPDEVLRHIVSYLEAVDRRRFMAVCWRMGWVTISAAVPRLTITENTGFAGIKKVLDSYPTEVQLEIICPDTCDKPLSAAAMFMDLTRSIHSSSIASSFCWKGITKVTIQGSYLRCLLPQFIALSCPQLEQLTIRQVSRSLDAPVFASNTKDALPLTYCSSVKQLKFDVWQPWHNQTRPPATGPASLHFGSSDRTSFHLPTAYHSPADLLHNLPNIDTLVFNDTVDAPSPFLIGTFAIQLTRLEVEGDPSIAQQTIRQCSKLQHLRINRLMLPDNPSVLKVLDLACGLSADEHIKILYQLPSLSTVHLGALQIETDWSDQPCFWQELHIAQLPQFTSLANINLRNIKKLSIGPHGAINLPDPSEPNSLAAVHRAAANLAHVGQIVIEDASTTSAIGRTRGCEAQMRWRLLKINDTHTNYRSIFPFIPVANTDSDSAASQMVTFAAQRIGPVKTCDLGNLLGRPMSLRAVIDWGYTFIESVCLGNECSPSAVIWHELQRLHTLKLVTMWPVRTDNGYVWKDGIWLPQVHMMNENLLEAHQLLLNSIIDTAISAAMHYVVPSQRRICLQFGARRRYNPYHAQPRSALLHLFTGQIPDSEKTLLRHGQLYLQVSIKSSLPAGSRLVSVDITTSNESYGVYSRYGWRYCWSVVVEPCEKPDHSAIDQGVEAELSRMLELTTLQLEAGEKLSCGPNWIARKSSAIPRH